MSIPSPTDFRHAFSIDVEEYFQVSAFEGHVARSAWDHLPSRVEESMERLLALLDRHGARCTCFVLGWVAERHPALVRRIADAGHEVASHGWWHRRVTTLRREEFREEVRATKAVLEAQCGRPVLGYRAPSFSVVPATRWALDVLVEEGYAYDSSLFPIRRSGYGDPYARPRPHAIETPAGAIVEFPLATFRAMGLRLPGAGGGYFRQLPYGVARRAIREQERAGSRAMFYIHPWEVDPGQPRLSLPWRTRLRHYRGIADTERRLARLLAEFSFGSAAEVLRELGLLRGVAVPSIAGIAAPRVATVP